MWKVFCELRCGDSRPSSALTGLAVKTSANTWQMHEITHKIIAHGINYYQSAIRRVRVNENHFSEIWIAYQKP